MYQKLLFTGFVIALLFAFHMPAHAQQTNTSPKPEGFTFQLGVGLSHQDFDISSTRVGQGISLGIGAYLKPNLALFLRASGSRVTQPQRTLVDREFKQSSAFVGASLQYWINDRFYLEGGGGLGYVDNDLLINKTGFSTLFGAGVTLIENRNSRINLGIENRVTFLNNKQVYNVGLSLGFQLK